ncbi:hydrolase [Candidatus Bipolaricaulota bacterium]|nr:hydrolase [Candidatus Bipolaricaulota bacterium]
MKNWKWVVLDIDGVLIDVSNSYDLAVKRTAKSLLSELCADGELDLGTIRGFRKRGKFGDDYRVTEGLVLAKLSSNFDELIAKFPRGGDLNWVKNRAGVEINKEKLRARFDQLYLEGGSSSGSGKIDGLWQQEKALVDPLLLDQINEKFSLGYITGRNRKEVELAEKILGYEIRNVVTREEFTKPNPQALKSLVGKENGVYIGDTHNDRLLVKNYNEEGGEFSFILVDENRPASNILSGILSESDQISEFTEKPS